MTTAFTQISQSRLNAMLFTGVVHVNQVLYFCHSGKRRATHIINTWKDGKNDKEVLDGWERTWVVSLHADVKKLHPPSVKTMMAWRCCSKVFSPTRSLMRAIRSKMVLKARFRSVPVCSAVGENPRQHTCNSQGCHWKRISDLLDPPFTENLSSFSFRLIFWPSKKSRMLTTSEISDEKKRSS